MLKYLLTLFLFTAFSADAWACSCLGMDIVRAYHASDAIFVGTTSEINKKAQHGPMEVTFTGLEMFNNYPSSKTIDIYTHPSSATCGYEFKLDTSYVVFAHRSDQDSHSSRENELHVSLCSLTTVSNERLIETLRAFKESAPQIKEHMCDREPCRLSTADANYLYGLRFLAAADPVATYDLVSSQTDQCVRAHGIELTLSEWAKKDPRSMLERLNGNFSNQLQCLTYEYGYVIDNALGEIKPNEAIAWLEQNNVTEHRDGGNPYQSYFHMWLHQDADSAMEWYLSNSDKVSARSLLRPQVFISSKDLFLKEYTKLDYKDKVETSLSLIESFERYHKDSLDEFVKEIDDTRVLGWVNLLITTWSGEKEPSIILNRTATSFLAGEKSSGHYKTKYPYGLYSMIQLVCLNDVPTAVREWIDETEYLESADKADLHAMLDSRQHMFDSK